MEDRQGYGKILRQRDRTMKIAERQSGIVQLVNERGSISFAEIQSSFPDVSAITLRRDMEALDKRNEIIRIHGGAKSINYIIHTDEGYCNRIIQNAEQKQGIARAAVSLLNPPMSVYVDSGTTALEFSKAFPDDNFLVYTHGLHCAVELSRLSRPEIHLVGGKVSRLSLSIVGSNAIYCLDNTNFDLVFLSAGGYSANRGFTCLGEEECYLRKAVVKRAEKVVMLLDSSKFGKVATYTLATPEEIDVLITDRGIDQMWLEEFRAHDIRVMFCEDLDR